VEVKSVDFDLTSFFKIDCDTFEKSFTGEFQTDIITSRAEIDIFEAALKKLVKDQEKYTPDIRAKIFIRYDDDDNGVLCLSDLGVVYNGDFVKATPELIKFVETLRK
jgi:hypothetical protein